MPYIIEEEKELVRKNGAQNAGDLNFLITEALHNYFMDHGHRYQQIHDISKLVRYVLQGYLHQYEGNNSMLRILHTGLTDIFFNRNRAMLDTEDCLAALQEAHAEFRRRVVAPYEDSCIARNGDVMREDLKELLRTRTITIKN